MKKHNSQEFAALFDNDGQVFETADGTDFDAVAERMGATIGYSNREYLENEMGAYEFTVGHGSEYIAGDPIRYEFPDGSSVVAAGGGWDFEGDELFSWRG